MWTLPVGDLPLSPGTRHSDSESSNLNSLTSGVNKSSTPHHIDHKEIVKGFMIFTSNILQLQLFGLIDQRSQ